MNIDHILNAAVDQFKHNIEDFCRTSEMGALSPQAAEDMGRGLQAALAGAGLAAYRAYLLGFETDADAVCAGGERFRFKAVREKCFLTPFGEMTLPRRCYQNKEDTRSHVPLDAAWGMEGQYMCPQVREAVLYTSAHVTPEETAAMLGKCALFTPHATAIKHAIERTGDLIETNRQALDEAVRAQETPPEDIRAVVSSLDGAVVLLREAGERFGRPAERPRGGESEAPATAYRVAMVGCVSFYGGPAHKGQPFERLQSRYVTRMPESRCPAFKARFEAEVRAARANAPPDTPCILLLDGARELWSYLDATPCYDQFHRCIDFWHAAEHLSKAADALFPGERERARKWYDKYYGLLLEAADAAQRICRSIDYYSARYKRSATAQKHLLEERTYFQRNGHRMPYAAFRAKGWPIGSGPIEAACKSLVKTRLCRSGMRWTRKGGQRILDLRTYVKSGRWESAWKHIKLITSNA